MTKDQARIVLLEQALAQAISTIEFLDGCLLSPNYHYSYPEQTQDRLREFLALVPQSSNFCVHSGFVPNCSSCQKRISNWNKRDEALKVLSS